MSDTTKREPLLSNDQITAIAKGYVTSEDIRGNRELQHLYNCAFLAAGKAADHYENLIDTGVLTVAKEVKFVSNDYDGNIDCDSCKWSICWIHVEDNPMKYCPGCGSKIVE